MTDTVPAVTKKQRKNKFADSRLYTPTHTSHNTGSVSWKPSQIAHTAQQEQQQQQQQQQQCSSSSSRSSSSDSNCSRREAQHPARITAHCKRRRPAPWETQPRTISGVGLRWDATSSARNAQKHYYYTVIKTASRPRGSSRQQHAFPHYSLVISTALLLLLGRAQRSFRDVLSCVERYPYVCCQVARVHSIVGVGSSTVFDC